MTVPAIPLARYRFHCCALEPIALPRYAGSAWRGAFGRSLKRTVCVTRLPRCSDCLLWRSCTYSAIFETPPPPDTPLLANYPAAPHPFILHPEANNGRRYRPGDRFEVELTLIGRTNTQLPYIVHAWQVMGVAGLGEPRGRYRLEAVSQLLDDRWEPIHTPGTPLRPRPPAIPRLPPPPAGRCRLVFETPVRVRHENRLMGPKAFRFRGLFASLLRRLSLLQHLHGDTPMAADFRTLVQRASPIEPLARRLRWFEWTRYSSRQRTEMQMGGLLGWVEFTATDLLPFWPWLALGQWLHVGKGTSMGLGRYRLENL